MANTPEEPPFYLSAMDPTRKRRTALVAGAVALAILFVAVGVAASVMLSGGKSPFGARTFTVHGTLAIADQSGYTASSAGGCAGANGYNDIGQGAAVVVSDAVGATVALGRLDEGHIAPEGGRCVFAFSVPNVPAGKGFYGVEISHRGMLKFSEGDAANTLALSL